MDLKKFRELLDEQMAFPDYYQFKFVVKAEKKEEVIQLLAGHQITEKLSKNGTYISVSSKKIFNNAEEIIEVYQRLSTVDGILSL